MSETALLKKALTRRLMPLYIAAFFQSFVLWYAIEKLFMQKIGFNNTEIGFMIALYSFVMLLVETPSGILADRWSRKGVLIVASICLAISCLVGGLSNGIGVYMITAVLWGVFYACYTGLYDSIVYDTIAETTDNQRLFDLLYGRVHLMDSFGLALGGLAGGLVASLVSLHGVYYFSVPFALCAVIALLLFDEPKIHKKQVLVPLRKQIKSTFSAVLKNRIIAPVVIVLILQAAILYTLLEFSQLWFLALDTPTAYYGPAYAIIITSIGLGGVLVSKLQLSKFKPMLTSLAVLLIGCLGLILFRDTITNIVAQFVVVACLIAVSVIFNRILHDSLTPSLRAGSSSAVGTLGRLVIIPISLLFGFTSEHWSVYSASYILLVLALGMSVFIMLVASKNNRTGLEAN